MNLLTLRLRAAASALVLALAACGGGGGGSAEPPPADPPPGTPAPNGLNPGFEGQLYFQAAVGSDSAAYVELDFRSGVLAVVRGGGGSAASADGSEFTFIEFDESELLDPAAHSTELVVFGRDGRARARFGRAGWMHGPTKLSPDGQRLAFEYSDEDDDPSGIGILNITDREGRVLKRYEGAAWWDWHPDGGLVVANEDAVYRIGPDLGAPVLVRRFPGDRPTDLAVSPDGSQIAFGLGDRELLANHLWLMKLDGSALRQLTTSGLNEDAPAWAPDGRHLAVRQGIAYGANAGGIPGGTCPVVWLVPADATQANLSTADNTTPAVQMHMLEDGATRTVCAFGSMSWRRQAAALPASDGTPAAGAGLNRGLAGRLTFDTPERMVTLDLQAGTTAAWPGDGSSPFPSADGSEVAFHAAEPDSGDNDDDQITVLNADGSRAAAVQVAGYFYSGPKLSADGRRIAARVWLDEVDSEPIITVFDRGGTVLARAPAAYEVFAWMPDGRLLLVAKNSIGVTDAALQVIEPLATLGDAVHSLAASPDGTRLALAMAGHVWLMNADGSALRQLTLSASTESAPAWSPDGRHVLLRHDGACPVLYAVPADGERVFIEHPAAPTSAWAVLQTEDGSERTVCAFSAAHWR
jgi:Tol biopolymer transport system component